MSDPIRPVVVCRRCGTRFSVSSDAPLCVGVARALLTGERGCPDCHPCAEIGARIPRGFDERLGEFLARGLVRLQTGPVTKEP